MEGNLGEFDGSLVINQNKTIQISSYNINNLWPILFIYQFVLKILIHSLSTNYTPNKFSCYMVHK